MYVKAEDLETPESRKALCEKMQCQIRAAKKHFKKDFDRMLEDMELCMTGKIKGWNKDCYTVNITQRFVRQKVASLYAKNPRATAKRKNRLEYRIWDGDANSLMAAQQQLMLATEEGLPPPPEATALIQDAQEGAQRSRMISRVGKSLELVYGYYTEEAQPAFKTQMKRCVRSAIQTSVGYMKLGFQREMELNPDSKAKIADFAARLAHIDRLQADLENGEEGLDPETAAEAEELRQSIASIEAEQQIILREGLVFDFPCATSIIPDPRTENLQGWVGADWLAEEIFLTCDEIKELFNLDIGSKGINYTPYSTKGAEYNRNPRNDLNQEFKELACCWVMYHKPSGMTYTMVDGFDDFVEEPEPPSVSLERFFPIYAFCYNEIEHPKQLFPPSDVRLMKDPQMELNRMRQAVREHRIANRPGYAIPGGSMSDEDKEMLGDHPANAVVEVDNLLPGQKIADVVQALPKIGVDPNLYETQGVMSDVYLSVGASESTFGTTSGATATEASIAESNRTGSLEAEIDELNDFLTQIARDSGQVLLSELSVETVKEIAGEGAIWPEMSQDVIRKELYLDVVAGSNGQPNRAQRQQALQQLVPFLMQVPGVNPEWLAKLMIDAVDDSIDLSEAIVSNIPSIMMMNNQSQPATDENDPNAQGAQGGNNADRGSQPSQGAGPQGNRDRNVRVAS